MSSLLLGTVGTALGGPVGGFIGSAIGSYIDNLIFAPKPPDIVGPKLSDTSSARADPGGPIPIVYGCDRVAGYVIGTRDLQRTRHKKKVGGKGGGGQTVKTYTYHVDSDILLCEGPILGIGRIWADGKVLRGPRNSETTFNDPTLYPNNTAGWNYPDRYNNAIYDPKLVPWSLNPELTATADQTQRYILADDKVSFLPIPLDQAELQVVAGKIVYWLDTATGYHIPLPNTHFSTDNRYVNTGTTFGLGFPSRSSGSNESLADKLNRLGDGGGSIFYTDPDSEVAEEIVPLDSNSMYDEFIIQNAAGRPPKKLKREWDHYYNLFDALNDFSHHGLFHLKATHRATLYRGTMDQLADTFMSSIIGHPVPAYRGRAHMVFDQLQLKDYANRPPNLSFEVVASQGVTMKYVVDDLLDRANISSENYDTSALDNTTIDHRVLGYTIARPSSFRSALDTILDNFSVSGAEIGHKLVFRPKNRAEVDHEVPFEDLSAAEAGDGQIPPTLPYVMKNTYELPQSLEVKFKDVTRAYQENTSRFKREITDSVQQSALDTGAVLPVSVAKRYARDKMQDVWLESTSVSFSLPHSYLWVSPTDIVTIEAPDRTHRILLTRARRGVNGVMEFEGVYRDTLEYVEDLGETDTIDYDNLYNLNLEPPGADDDTDIMFLDLPPLRDTDTAFGYYVALSGVTEAWAGAVVYRSTDGGQTYTAEFSKDVPGVIGVVSSGALPYHAAAHYDVTSPPFVVTVSDEDALIFSITSEQLQNLSNFAVVGNEIIQFSTAVYLGDEQWRLEGPFARGRLGTDSEEILSGHMDGERFALLDPEGIYNVEDVISTRNNNLLYRPVTNGDTLVQANTVQFTNTGKRLMPFSPVQITGLRDGSNNATISWVRRNRFFHYVPIESEIPMSEDFERYEVDIYDASGTFAIRTLTVENATEVVYTAAEQVTDGLTPGDSINIRVYQMSALVGRGNAGIGAI